MNAAQLPAPQLGRILIAAGLLSEEQLAQALEEQTRTGRRLGEIIVQRGFVSGPALANALAEQHGGALKTEYGFASGLGGIVASRAAFEAGTPVSQLRPPDPSPIPRLRTAEPHALPAPSEEEQAPAAPEESAEPVPQQEPPEPVAVTEPAIEPTPPAEVPEPTPETVGLRPPAPKPTQETPLVAEVAPSVEPEPTRPAEAAEAVLEPKELRPPASEPVEVAPSAPESEPEPEQSVAAELDDRDALIESLRARGEAQELELTNLREQLEQERARKDVQVHVLPEGQPVATAGAVQTEHYLLCVPTAAGYVLLDRVGALPSLGQAVEVPEEEGRFTVTKVVRLPRNGRSCAYLQRA